MEDFKDCRIAILDDDPRVRDTLSLTIRSWGLRAEGFNRPEAAVDHIGQNGCDVVLLDILILNTSGPELIGQFGNDLKIIVTTEPADKDAAVRALKLGVFDLLEKPFRNELLRHSIWRALAVLENERATNRLSGDLEQSRSGLLARKRRLEILNSQLLETNRALSVLARNMEREREEMEGQISARLRNLLMPIVMKLRNEEGVQKYEEQLNMLIRQIEDLASESSIDPGAAMRLSSAEMGGAPPVEN